MAAKVYTFHITYGGLEERIWRKVEVSSNYRLDQLGYLVLATFDTMAYHLFEFQFRDRCYEIPDEYSPSAQIDMAAFKLCQLGLTVGDQLCMEYDFGTTQYFRLELIGCEDMLHGHGRRYPRIVDGAGQGILDDVSSEELAELIAQIDRKGKTDNPIYYQDRPTPWDYRRFELDMANFLMRTDIPLIEEGYAPFWQEQS